MLAKVTGLLQAMHRRRMAPPHLDQLRLAGLRAVVRHSMERVPFYRALFREAGIRIEDIRSLADIRRLPVIDKPDLRNAGTAATVDGGVRREGWSRLHTSGTTGEPLSIWLSEQERRRRLLREFRALLSIGFRPSDRLAILGPEGASSRGWHERLGLFRTVIIPASLPTAERLKLLCEFQPTILWAYPTVLHEVAEEAGWRLSGFIRPRTLITSAQYFRPAFRDRVLADLDAEHFVLYAANEVGRIGVECSQHHGLHIEADALIVEIAEGIEGLVHVSELDHGRIENPAALFKKGEEMEVVVLNIDPVEQRISLSRKRLLPPPPPKTEEERPRRTKGKEARGKRKPGPRREERREYEYGAVAEYNLYDASAVPTASASVKLGLSKLRSSSRGMPCTKRDEVEAFQISYKRRASIPALTLIASAS